MRQPGDVYETDHNLPTQGRLSAIKQLPQLPHLKTALSRAQSTQHSAFKEPVEDDGLAGNLNNEAYQSKCFQNSIYKFKEPYSNKVNHNSNDAKAKKTLAKLQLSGFKN